MTFPDGWISGSPPEIGSYLADLETTDPRLAAQLKEANTLSTSQFVAYQTSSSEDSVPSVGCTTQDVAGMRASDVLDLAEQQNREAIAALPETTVAPQADRVRLPAGEAVRIRWQWAAAPSGAQQASVGYLFVSRDLMITCVFGSLASMVGQHETEWLAILRTFARRP